MLLSRFAVSALVGTGSSPPLENGLHRTTLHRARAVPMRIPHSATASRAYCEQVGENRQVGTGFRGERKRR